MARFWNWKLIHSLYLVSFHSGCSPHILHVMLVLESRKQLTLDPERIDRIILSFRKPFLSFYIYLLLIWLFMFIFIFLCCFLTTSCSKSWDRYHFGNTGISVDFYVYVPINTYRRVEEQFFYIFIAVLRLFEKKNSICRTYVLYPIIFCRTYWNFAGPEFTKF
jgi:hypothetical protein